MSTPPTNIQNREGMLHSHTCVYLCMCAVRLLEVGWREPPVETETRVPAPGQLTYKKLKDN